MRYRFILFGLRDERFHSDDVLDCGEPLLRIIEMTAHIRCILPLLPLFLMGCSKITPQNYNQLEAGMSYESVINILGNPKDCTEQLKTQSCVWKEKEKCVRATFVVDKLVLYSSEGLE